MVFTTNASVYTTYTYKDQVTTMASIQPSPNAAKTYFASFWATHRVDPTGDESPDANFVCLRFSVDAMGSNSSSYSHQDTVNLNSSDRHINTAQINSNYSLGVPLTGDNVVRLEGEFVAWYEGTTERWNTPAITVDIDDYQ